MTETICSSQSQKYLLFVHLHKYFVRNTLDSNVLVTSLKMQFWIQLEIPHYYTKDTSLLQQLICAILEAGKMKNFPRNKSSVQISY